MAKDYYTQKKEKALREKKVFIDSTPYKNYDSIIVLMDGTEIRFRHEKPGLNIMLGYQYTSFKVLKSISKVNGMKCSLLFLL